MSEETGVTVPRSVIFGVLGGLVVGCLLGLGFIIGRQSPVQAPPAASAPAAVQAPVVQQRVTMTVPTPPSRGEAESPTPARGEPSRMAAVDAERRPAPPARSEGPPLSPVASPTRSEGTTSTATEPADPAMRKQVAAYFTAMDRALAVAKKWDTADSVTQAAITQSTRRDPRQLKAILDANRVATEDVGRIVPPPPCRGYHVLAQEILVKATRLVENVATSAITGNLDDLGEDLAPAARAVREEAATMQAMRADLCRRYGLPVPGNP